MNRAEPFGVVFCVKLLDIKETIIPAPKTTASRIRIENNSPMVFFRTVKPLDGVSNTGYHPLTRCKETPVLESVEVVEEHQRGCNAVAHK